MRPYSSLPVKKGLAAITIIVGGLGLIGIFLFSLMPTEASTSQIDPEPTIDPAQFQTSDPYVCLIPEDGGFLPCHANLLADEIPIQRSPVSMITNEPCQNGMADGYPCSNIDLLSFLPLSNFNNVMASDIWGWTDPETGAEIVIMTQRNQVSFVDISDPLQPAVLGFLPKPATASATAWRDVKTYGNHAYIVGDLSGSYGMQIFDLTRLRSVTETTTFDVDARYQGVGSSHNIVINEESGLAAIVGASSGQTRCSGGMHLLDLTADPTDPAFLGCVNEDGYVHDAQCVIYHGPDSEYQDKEICFNFNTSAVTIVDITDRTNPSQISRTTYQQSAYTHQGWVTPDHKYLLVDDESDESQFDINTTTLIFDVTDLSNPVLIDTYTADTAAIDHNQYIHLGYSFQANYRAGLRILDVANIEDGTLEEVGYFDVFPSNDSANFNGAWSVYPYFDSGVLAISGIEQGLFLVKPNNLEMFRAKIHASEAISIMAGSSLTQMIHLQTLGAEDVYTASIISGVIPASIVGSPQISGDATQLSALEVEFDAPLGLTGTFPLEVRFESSNRSGYVVSKTVDIVVQNDPFFALNLRTNGIASTAAGRLVHGFEIINESNVAERFNIQVTGSPWIFTTSVNETPELAPNESFGVLIFGEVVNGPTGTYTLTAESQVDVSIFDSVTESFTVRSGVEFTTTDDATGVVGQVVSRTITLTNRGDVAERLTMDVFESDWTARIPVRSTPRLEPNQSADLLIYTTVGNGDEGETVLILGSEFSEDLARFAISTRTNRMFLPVMIR